MSQSEVITLEGNGTPDILLNEGENVLLDVSQGFRDLGLAGLILRHKGRLIVTDHRAIYFKKKTKDFEIEQLNMKHAGYVKMGYNLMFKQFIFGLALVIGALGLFTETIFGGLILLLLGLFIVYTARVKGLMLSGSGEKISFASQSIPTNEFTKVITITAANS